MRRAIETDEHQVQVGGERVHRHHFRRPGAHHLRQRVAHQLVIRHPRCRFKEVSLDRIACPLVEDFLDHRARAPGLQAERVAAEIGLRRAVVERQVELIAERAQGIGGVLRGHPRGVEELLGVVHQERVVSKREACRPSHSSAVPL